MWRKAWHTEAIFVALLILSVAVKLYAAQLLAWEADYVPLITRGRAWLDGGAFPVVGTLSSVAAFNLPFLVWMQLPAQLLTRDVPTILIGTQLLFNLLGSWIAFLLGRRLYGDKAGLLGALLFTFSEVGISSAFTAWAQLLLPGFFLIFAYCLVMWRQEKRAWHVALTWIAATAAFMTHFSAVVLYAVIIVFMLALRLPLKRRGLSAGVVLSALMLLPWLQYQSRVNFVDLRAFLTQQPTLDAATLAGYAHLKPGYAAQPAAEDESAANESVSEPASQAPPSRLERGLRRALDFPGDIVAALRLGFSVEWRGLDSHSPLIGTLSPLPRLALELAFWLGIAHALWVCGRGWLVRWRSLKPDERGWCAGLRLGPGLLTESAAGWHLSMTLFMLVVIATLFLTRQRPNENATYYAGLSGLQFVMCGYWAQPVFWRRAWAKLLFALLLLYAGFSVADRVVSVAAHDPARYTPQNLALYRNVNAAVDFIASDWRGGDSLTVSYDLLPELAYHWWIVPWHTVDAGYRMGMAYDHLLLSYHGLRNENRAAIGLSREHDYVITTAPGMARYDAESYAARQFGAIVVMKPLAGGDASG